jgi:hypothetical protein
MSACQACCNGGSEEPVDALDIFTVAKNKRDFFLDFTEAFGDLLPNSEVAWKAFEQFVYEDVKLRFGLKQKEAEQFILAVRGYCEVFDSAPSSEVNFAETWVNILSGHDLIPKSVG